MPIFQGPRRSGVVSLYYPICAVLLCALSVSCGSAVRISKAGSQVSGIPFFIKKAACKHEMVWLEPLYVLELTRTVPASAEPTKPIPQASGPSKPHVPAVSSQGDPPAEPATKSVEKPVLTLPMSAFAPADSSKPSVKKLINLLGEPNPDVKQIEAEWKQLAALAVSPVGQGFPTAGNRILISNTVQPEIYVDYADPYYYNAKKPVIGSVNISAELAADGTLNKGSAQAEEKTVQSFLDLLPVKDVLSTAAKAAIGGGPPAGAPPPAASYTLKLDVKVFKHTRSALTSASSLPCMSSAEDLSTKPTPGTSADLQYSYTREEIKATPPSESTSQVKFSGAVEMPKKPSTPSK